MFGGKGSSVALLAVGVILSCWVVLLAMSADPTGARTGGTTGDTTGFASADQYLDDDFEEGCTDPRTIETFSGSEDRITDQFEVTGDTFRITYETTVSDPDAVDESLDVTVLDEDGAVIDSFFVSESGSGSETILAGPGTFSLEIEAGDIDYEITVEDCTGDGDDNGGDDNGDDDKRDRVVVEEQTVIIRTIPRKPLPPTGGLPVYFMVAGSILAGASLLGVRIAKQRGRQG